MVSLNDTVIIILDSVKHYKGFEILSYLQINKLAFQGFIEADWIHSSCVGDKDHYYSQHNTQHKMYLHIKSPCSPSTMGLIKSGPSASCMYSRSVSQLSNPKLKKPQFYESTCSTFPLKANIMFILVVRKQMFPLHWRETLPLCYKPVCCYANVLEEIAQSLSWL